MEREVASFLGLQPDQVLLTNGVDEAIHLICETYLEPEDEAVIVVPTFAMYEICAASTGARVISVPADEISVSRPQSCWHIPPIRKPG